MFWGLIMEPNKRYTQVVEKPFHISQAAMDISTGDNEPCQVMVVVDNKNFLVCTLRKKECVQQPLGLYFKQGDRVAFLTNGKCNIHLTGYLDPDYETDEGDEEEADDEEEELVDVAPAKNKRKLENGAEDVTSKKAKQTGKKNKKAAADSSDSEDDDEDQLQRFLDGEEMDTDDNDDSFKVNTSGEADDSDEDEDDDDEEEDEAEEDDDEEEEEKPKKVDKKNKKTSSSAEEADTTLDTSKEDTEVDMSKLSKSQRRRLKKKLQQQNKQPQVNGVAKKEEAKKPEAKKAEAKKESPETPSADKKEKKQLSGGVNIEDLKVGTGPVAKPGKVVMVYYEGRLKQNNKMFDNCLKGPGFKFRLGSKEVISGWDVGIAGMKVGGKRKIVCPPAMAYGAKGSPPVIPPNSTLVFEVELKNVK